MTIPNLQHDQFWSAYTGKCSSNNATGVLISPLPDQEGKKLQRPNSNCCKPLKKKIHRILSVQPGLRGSNDLRVGRKMATFQLFIQPGRDKDLSAPLYLMALLTLRFQRSWISGLLWIRMQ
jgi:hypothetical protein